MLWQYLRGQVIVHTLKGESKDDMDSSDESLFFFIVLGRSHSFDFPPFLCGRMHHQRQLSPKEIYKQVFKIRQIKSLTSLTPQWESFHLRKGWSVATPTPGSSVEQDVNESETFILNVFDLSDRTKVVENVIKPLTAGSALVDLESGLTIPYYRLPILDDEAHV